MTTREKVQKLYRNKKNWKPPSYQWIADEVGITKSLVWRYVHELSTVKKKETLSK